MQISAAEAHKTKSESAVETAALLLNVGLRICFSPFAYVGTITMGPMITNDEAEGSCTQSLRDSKSGRFKPKEFSA